MLIFKCDLCGKEIELDPEFIKRIESDVAHGIRHQSGLYSLELDKIFVTFDDGHCGHTGKFFDCVHICPGECTEKYKEIKKEITNEYRIIRMQKIKEARADNRIK